jgi:hypothetical protein
MNRFVLIFCGLLFATVSPSFGQWSAEQPVDTRTEPIYATNPYTFRSASANYDPYQFNWDTGRWDYVPVPYSADTPGANYSPYRFNTATGHWDYVPVSPPSMPTSGQMPPAPPPPPAQNNIPGAGAPTAQPPPADDSALWNRPTTQPTPQTYIPRTLTFSGRIVSERAIDLSGSPPPHLLLRLLNSDGASGTVDVGDYIDLSKLSADMGKDQTLTVNGYLGEIDGTPVLFATTIRAGSTTITVDRPHRMRRAM